MERWLDMLCCSVLGLALLVTAFLGRKFWWILEISVNLFYGVAAFLFAKTVLGFQTSNGDLNEVHLVLARVCGAYCLGFALSWYKSKDSFDFRMISSHLYARLLAVTLLIICHLFSAYHLWDRKSIKLNERFLMHSCFAEVGLFIGNLVNLLKYKEIGGYAYRPGWLNTGLLLDHFFLLVFGICMFAFPMQALKFVLKPSYVLDGVHVMLIRTVACQSIQASFGSFAAPGFLFVEDKKAHVLGRLLTATLIFLINVYSHFVLDLFSMYNVTPFMISGFYITFLLTLYFQFNKNGGKNIKSR